MAITLNPDFLAQMTPEQKAATYNQLMNLGFGDSQILDAVNAQVGQQTAGDWSYLQGLAGRQSLGGAEADRLAASMTPQQKADFYSQGLAAGKTDEQLRNYASGMYGPQSDTDWNYLRQLAGPVGGAIAGTTRAQTSPFNTFGTANPQDALSAMLSGNVDTSALDPVLANANRRLGEQFNEQVLPGIRGGAMAAGQYGGSRQGVAEGLAARGLGYAMGDMAANMYNNAFNTAQQQRYGTANNLAGLGVQYDLGLRNYDLGLRNNDLGFGQLDANIANMNTNNQFRGADLAMRAYDQMMGYNGLGLNAAGNMQNTPFSYYNNFANIGNSIAGQGGVSNQAMPGNPLLGAVGGAQLGGQMWNWWDRNGASPMTTAPAGSFYNPFYTGGWT